MDNAAIALAWLLLGCFCIGWGVILFVVWWHLHHHDDPHDDQ